MMGSKFWAGLAKKIGVKIGQAGAQMVKTAASKRIESVEPPDRIVLSEATEAGFFKLAKPMGWGLYRAEDIDGGLGSIWSIEKGADGSQFLVKQVDPEGEVLRKTAGIMDLMGGNAYEHYTQDKYVACPGCKLPKLMGSDKDADESGNIPPEKRRCGNRQCKYFGNQKTTETEDDFLKRMTSAWTAAWSAHVKKAADQPGQPPVEKLWEAEYEQPHDGTSPCESCGGSVDPDYRCRRCGAFTCGSCGTIPEGVSDSFLCMPCEEMERMDAGAKIESGGQDLPPINRQAPEKKASTVYCSEIDCKRVAHDKSGGKYYCSKHLPEKRTMEDARGRREIPEGGDWGKKKAGATRVADDSRDGDIWKGIMSDPDWAKKAPGSNAPDAVAKRMIEIRKELEFGSSDDARDWLHALSCETPGELGRKINLVWHAMEKDTERGIDEMITLFREIGGNEGEWNAALDDEGEGGDVTIKEEGPHGR